MNSTCHSRLLEQFLESQVPFGATFCSKAATWKLDQASCPEEDYWKYFQN
jgi:hypothetical protein